MSSPPVEETTALRHVALICDGSARWAEREGVSIADGHAAAAGTVLGRVADAIELGIVELTVYAFSTENWQRPAIEVDGLLELIAERVTVETPSLAALGVRMRFIGRRGSVPSSLREATYTAELTTTRGQGLRLYVAIDYGGRAEIIDAATRFAGGDESDFAVCLYAPEMRDPDLIIRTGGERRLSNYLLWQAAYAELIFRDELWPDFDRACFHGCLSEYAERRRRFGRRGDPGRPA